MLVYVLISLLGIIGYFTHATYLFFICGFVNFIPLIIYLYRATKEKNVNEDITMIFEYKNESFIKQRKFVRFTSRLITYAITCLILYYFFKWYAFVWVSIAFGFGYILEVVKALKNENISV